MEAINQKGSNLPTKGASAALVGRLLGRFLSVAGDILAARILGPAIFGLYAIGWTIFRFVDLITPLGFDVGVLRHGARHLDRDDLNFRNVIIQSILAPFLFSLLLAILFYLFAPWFAERLFNKPDLVYIFRFVAIAFPLSALLSVISSVLRLVPSLSYSVVVQDLGQPLIALILLGGFYLFSLRLTGVLLSNVLSYGICLAAGVYFLKILFPSVFDAPRQGFSTNNELYTYSLVSALGGVFATLIFWVDRLFVGHFFSAADTGIYQAASQFSVIFAVILGSLNRVVMPIFAKLSHDGERSLLENVFQVSTRWGIYLSVPILLVLFITPAESLSALYGAVYGRGAPVLLMLVLGQFFNLISGPVVPLLVLTGHQNDVFWLSALSFFLSILLLWVFVPGYGLVGASVATTISLAVFFGVALLVARRKVGCWPYDRRFIKGVIGFVASAFVAFFLRSVLQHWNPLPLVIFEGCFAAMTFAAVLFVLKFDQKDIELLKSLLLK